MGLHPWPFGNLRTPRNTLVPGLQPLPLTNAKGPEEHKGPLQLAQVPHTRPPAPALPLLVRKAGLDGSQAPNRPPASPRCSAGLRTQTKGTKAARGTVLVSAPPRPGSASL